MTSPKRKSVRGKLVEEPDDSGELGVGYDTRSERKNERILGQAGEASVFSETFARGCT